MLAKDSEVDQRSQHQRNTGHRDGVSFVHIYIYTYSKTSKPCKKISSKKQVHLSLLTHWSLRKQSLTISLATFRDILKICFISLVPFCAHCSAPSFFHLAIYIKDCYISIHKGLHHSLNSYIYSIDLYLRVCIIIYLTSSLLILFFLVFYYNK